MSANSAVQHLSSGVGAAIGGKILIKSAGGAFLHYERVGLVAVTATLLSLWIAGLVRPAAATKPVKSELDLDPVDLVPPTVDARDGDPRHRRHVPGAEFPQAGQSV